MTVTQRSILLCTVGTSLFSPKLEGVKRQLSDGSLPDDLRPLAEEYREKLMDQLAEFSEALMERYLEVG